MRILNYNKLLFPCMLFVFSFFSVCAQNTGIVLVGEDKFDFLLNEKRKINPSISLKEGYKIQIFSGESEKAKKIAMMFRQEFEGIDVTIVFNTPNYRVWVGNFKTRIESERFLIAIRKKYSNALLIKPSK